LFSQPSHRGRQIDLIGRHRLSPATLRHLLLAEVRGQIQMVAPPPENGPLYGHGRLPGHIQREQNLPTTPLMLSNCVLSACDADLGRVAVAVVDEAHDGGLGSVETRIAAPSAAAPATRHAG
jgi:hypothetical protein